MKRFLSLAAMVLGCLPAADLPGADWPQYRYDASRSAASPEQLPTTLRLQWVRELPEPQPAFPAEVRLRYDGSYEPVVLGKTLFLPSMVTDSLTALDTETGAQRWHFFAEGPVRFAPVVWQDQVYFISDDGHLYCLGAADGSLRWKFQGLPPGKTDRRLLGHGRLISLWPARGGPVLHDGVLYFGCGLWSTYGVSVHALDAATGKVVWSNTDSNQIPKANMDHGIANFAGLTPQGYLAIVHDKLVVPCGAQLPAFLDLKTGKLDTYTMGWGGRNGLPKGTWFVAGTKNFLSHSGDLYDLARLNDEQFANPSQGRPDFKSLLYPGGFTRLEIDRTNQKDLGAFSEPILAADVMYDNTQGLVAYDLADGKLEERSKSQPPQHRKDDTYPDKWKATFAERWRFATDLKAHIQAGDHLYLGGEGRVEAVRIPAAGEEPRVVWEAKTQGTPHRMLAADGKLFVVTREGRLYAFAGSEITNPTVHARPAASSPAADAWTRTASDILQATKVHNGYALVLGSGSGRLAEELVRQSDLYVIAVDRDPAKVAQLREKLHRDGLYGSRASAHLGDPSSYPLPPYLASLIVSEDWGQLGSAAGSALLRTVFQPLRPYGGTACLAISASQCEAMQKELAESRLAQATVRQAGDWTLVSREGPLPGSSDWTHPEANAANTGACEDQFVKPPLDLLWFDGPARWFRTPGTTLVRVCSGRMLIKAEKLQAFDVFTGRRLWETALPAPHSATDQFVALDDAIYLTSGKDCLVLDPATGQKSGQISLPAGLTGGWLNFRAWQDYLVGQSGMHLVSMNRRNGEPAWKYECGRPDLSVAVGGGKVFCAELVNPRRGETAAGPPQTRALDIKTGEVLWQISGGSEVRYCEALDLVVAAGGVYRAKDGSLAATLPTATAADEKPRPQEVPRPLFVVGERLLWGTAEKFMLYDLLSGEPAGDATSWTRRGCTVPRASSNLVTTRVLGNAACIDLASREVTAFWNVRAACSNNLFPADGVLNMPSLTGGCTCNYLPVSQAYVPSPAPAK
ncbi:MAG: PQQ-binding-like beta-propeller repeat protein [Pirellulales bacterium]|nr:PQQ-binding-like beta-propeller repeat protein [Pirellulales bacterium]